MIPGLSFLSGNPAVPAVAVAFVLGLALGNHFSYMRVAAMIILFGSMFG